jgi:hypothetical protein
MWTGLLRAWTGALSRGRHFAANAVDKDGTSSSDYGRTLGSSGADLCLWMTHSLVASERARGHCRRELGRARAGCLDQFVCDGFRAKSEQFGELHGMTRCVRGAETGEECCRLTKAADLGLGVVQSPGPPLDSCRGRGHWRGLRRAGEHAEQERLTA